MVIEKYSAKTVNSDSKSIVKIDKMLFSTELSIVSALTEIPVNKDVAMTGEITLRGLVLPIGGLKEKLLAAHRAGIKKVLIPLENKKDLIEVPKTVLDSIQVITVKNIDEVLKVALIKPLKRVEWVELDEVNKNKVNKNQTTSRH